MKIKKEYKIQNVGGENIILLQGTHGMDATKIVSFNETSLWLWEEFTDKDFTTEQVADSLMEQFGIDAELAKKDAVTWVDLLTQNQLIGQ